MIHEPLIRDFLSFITDESIPVFRFLLEKPHIDLIPVS